MSHTRGRILLDATPVCLETSARGIGRHVACLLPQVADSLRANGWDVVEAGLRGSSAALIPDVPQVRFWSSWLLRRLDPWQRQLLFSSSLTRVARTQGAAAILCTDTSLFPAPSAGIRTGLMMYDLIPLLDPKVYVDTYKRGNQWLWKSRLPQRWREADIVFTSTREVADQASRLFGVPASLMQTVPPGVDHLSAPQDPSRIEAGIGHPFFLYVGAIEVRKNVQRLIQAFASFRRSREDDVKLVLAGPLAPFRRKMVEAWAAEAGILEHVIPLGRVEDDRLFALYRGCVAFVFPSLMEGFGLPPLEAMRAGAPVLAARASCMPEVLGEAAAWFDGLDVVDMARNMAAIAGDPTLRAKLSAAGPDRAALFTWRSAGERIADALTRGL